MNGLMTTRGWSTFESIQMCEAMGITPVLTLKSAESYSDLADLVDYLYAEDDGNQWGRLRAQDGHPAPYNISWFELGAHHRAHLCVCCSPWPLCLSCEYRARSAPCFLATKTSWPRLKDTRS